MPAVSKSCGTLIWIYFAFSRSYADRMDEITSASMQRLLGVNKSVLNDLVKHGIVQHGKKRGCTGIPPAGVPAFVLAQLAGAIAATAFSAWLFSPRPPSTA